MSTKHLINRRCACLAAALAGVTWLIVQFGLPHDMSRFFQFAHTGRPCKVRHRTSMPIIPFTSCPQDISPSCFVVDRCLDNRHACLAIKPVCSIGEYYPVMEISHGHRYSASLGRRQHTRSAAFEFDVLAAEGMPYAVRANLTLSLYFQCAANMYDQNAFFIGLDNNDNASIPINRVVYTNDAVRLTGQSRTRREDCWSPLQPLAVDRKTARLLTDRVPITPQALAPNATSRYSSSPWIHLSGDSNMRNVFKALCELCGSVIPLEPRPATGTCFCPKSASYVHYDVSWLGYMPFFNRTGARLSDIVPLGSMGADVHSKAAVTIVSLGSHSAEISINDLRDFVRRDVLTYSVAVADDGLLVVALTTAVCIERIPEKYARVHGPWEILLRNNYRIWALNDLIVDACNHLRAGVLDLFSWSLSAGCDHYSDAVHMEQAVYVEFARMIAQQWMPALLERKY